MKSFMNGQEHNNIGEKINVGRAGNGWLRGENCRQYSQRTNEAIWYERIEVKTETSKNSHGDDIMVIFGRKYDQGQIFRS